MTSSTRPNGVWAAWIDREIASAVASPAAAVGAGRRHKHASSIHRARRGASTDGTLLCEFRIVNCAL
jgi:hypothetical protein